MQGCTKRMMVVVLIAVGVLTGCTTSKDSVLPDGGLRMIDIYHGHFGQALTSRPTQSPTEHKVDEGPPRSPPPAATPDSDVDVIHAAARRGVAPRIECGPGERARRLANPDIEITVFEHFVADGVPIPEYTTVLPLYEKPQYTFEADC